jgi:endonuclease/exonuclease/phosphatase family metal-dependent hydrolase
MQTFHVAITLMMLLIPVTTMANETDHDSGATTLRIATYNVSLYDKAAGLVQQRLRSGTDRHASNIAAVIQTVRPDILLINEIDYDPNAQNVKLFADNYLAKPQDGCAAIEYPYRYAAASNTGIDSTVDLNGDGKLATASDAFGFGNYPGQYAFAILSRYPISEDRIRTFQHFLWKDFPNAKQPVDPVSGKPYYSDQTWDMLRLASKNHIDVPIQIGDSTLHLLASHPTPPVFDGPEDRNGNRNHDEVDFWNRYVSQPKAQWLVDDSGISGGLATAASFVIAGDLNTDPDSGDSLQEAIVNLLANPRVQDPVPSASGDADCRATAQFGPDRQMRVDYVLPSVDLKVLDSQVFWPKPSDPESRWIGVTDHRLVWVQVRLP